MRDIDYKNVDILKKYVPERGKIAPRRVTGTCAYHQRKLATAIKRARLMAMLPYLED
jgi:small subunit ribosomal protein S18